MQRQRLDLVLTAPFVAALAIAVLPASATARTAVRVKCPASDPLVYVSARRVYHIPTKHDSVSGSYMCRSRAVAKGAKPGADIVKRARQAASAAAAAAASAAGSLTPPPVATAVPVPMPVPSATTPPRR